MTLPGPSPYGGFPPDYYGYPPKRSTNGMAIASLVTSFLFAPLGIVFGHISLSQIRRTGEEGRGMAIAGLVIGYVITAVTLVVVLLAALLVVVAAQAVNDAQRVPGNNPASPSTGGELPAFDPPSHLGDNCQYPASEPASKPARPPRTGAVPTEPAEVGASIRTDRGNIGLMLDNAKSPCTVNSFVSLAQQGYFDGTTCHRLTTSPLLHVLQCGDPTGTGTGGPGYRFPNEYPSNQYRLSDPGLRSPLEYPRGTLAMANAGPGTNGSQFFLVYEDSMLPPTYTVFGTIDEAGLAVLDQVAARGVADGSDDGAPATEVTIESARLN